MRFLSPIPRPRRLPVRVARPHRPRPRPRVGLEPLEDRVLPASLAINDVSLLVGNGGTQSAVFTVTLSGHSRLPVVVRYATADGTAAAADRDYQPVHGTLTFRRGETTRTIAVPVFGHPAPEPDETFSVLLSRPNHAHLGRRAATALIHNQDSVLSVGNVTATVGAGGTATAVFSVQLSAPTPAPVTVQYATADGTASAAAGNYVPTSGTLMFQPGQTTATVAVQVAGAAAGGPPRTFVLNLSNATGAVGGGGQATGTIVTTTAQPALSIGSVTLPEGNSGTTPFGFTVTLSNPSSEPVTVQYATADGTATVADNDYQAASGILTFAPGETSKTVTVLVNGDTIVEPDETFMVQLSAPGNATIAAGQGTGTGTLTDGRQVTGSGPQILLTPATLDRLRQLAAANDPQWQAFKSRLDNNLGVVIADNIGSYQGEQLTWISDYALGYQVLKDSDPRTAADYADKAIGLIKSGLRDYQKGSWVARQFLARGDGSTRTFTLPNADLLPASLQVYLAAVTTQPVIHGPTDGQDSVDFYRTFLEVSNTPDGPPDYAQGVDWRYNPDYGNDQIDWSLPGKEPAPGATYYVTSTSGLAAQATTAFTLNGSTITFDQAPAANQAVFVQYIYGTHSADGSTLAYQQTSAGDGGFNSIFVDDTYTYRYLGKHIAMGLDWLDGYVGFGPALKEEASNLLVRWSDYIQANGYLSTSVASNYGAAAYASEALTALALAPRSPDGPRLLTAVLASRQNNLLPLIQNPTDSLYGGFWAEGWNYGNNAAQTILLASQALEDAGQISAAPERQWADQVIEDLVSAQPATDQLYDGGDWYAYPVRFPDKALFYTLGFIADNPTDRAYANYVLQQYPDSAFLTPGDTNDYRDLLFHDPSAPASFWSALPLQDLATGTGLLTARSDRGSTPTWFSLQMGNLLNADHQTYSPGQLQISRGDDQLLVNANAVSISGDSDLAPTQRSQFSNLVAVDDHGEGNQRYPFSMGVWYGTPGVVINAYEAAGDHVYLSGDYHVAYSPDSNPGSGGPTSQLTRQVVYLRPGTILVYDRVTTIKDYYDKQLRWHFNQAPTLNGNAFTETVGGSRLFAQTFSTSPISTSVAQVQVDGNPAAQVYRVTTQNTGSAAAVRYLTAFQVATATTPAMDATQHVVTADGRMEGVEIGGQLVLFGHDGAVDLQTPVSYTLSGGSVAHLLTDLQPGQTYLVRANGNLLTSVVAGSQGTIAFTTPAGTHAVQVSR